MGNLIVRCSSIGALMAKPTNDELDAEFMTSDLVAIIAKTKRTDAEKAMLAEAQRKSLSTGGKTHVRQLLREAIYGFEPADIETRPILKGRAVESQCIDMLSRLIGRALTKNSDRRSNGVIAGECDVWDEPIRHGRDVKAPYSMETMPITLADCYDSGYEWQMRGYMALWNAEAWSVDYVLVSTPDDLVGYEPPALHFVDHIPEHLRWTSWIVKRDRALEDLIADKVSAARRYYQQAMNEFDRTHQLLAGCDPVEILAEAAAAPAAVESDSTPARSIAPGEIPETIF